MDRPVVDLVAAGTAASEASTRWGLPPPSLLRRGMNAIYTAGDRVLRVGLPTVPGSASIALARVLRDHSIRVPMPARDEAVEHGQLSVTCWERVADTGMAVDWEAVGEMVRAVHGLDPARLPQDYPMPSPATFPWWDFPTMLRDVETQLDDAAARGLRAVVDDHRDWARFDTLVVCHGDVHPGNVLMAEDGPVLLDWDLLCHAAPEWDHAPLMRLHERWGGPAGTYEAFASGYGQSFRDEARAEGLAELRLVAATLLRLRAARHDPAALDEATKRLAYWRGERRAATWSAH